MQWVKLNVGGEMFETKLTTLTSVPGSLLAKLFQPDSMGNSQAASCLHCQMSENNMAGPCLHSRSGDMDVVMLNHDTGVFHLDMDPVCFSAILTFLRHRVVGIAPTALEPSLLARAAEQLGLQELANMVRVKHRGGARDQKAHAMTDWLKLNVGGTMFETSRATLTSHPNSSLARMFAPQSGLSPATMEDGVYHLDACPRAFSVILNWLRYRKLMLDGVSPGEVGPVADYFGLGDLNATLAVRAKKDEAKEKSLVDSLDACTDRLEEALQQIQSEIASCQDKLEDIKIEVAGAATGLEDLWRIKCEVATIASNLK